MVHYELMDKRTGEIPSLDDIDKQICDILGKHYDPQHFCYLGNCPEWRDYINWNNTVSLAMAMGKTYQEIRELWPDSIEILAICDYLESKYKIINWRS